MLIATLELTKVEELASAQQKIYVLSVNSITLNDDANQKKGNDIHDISNFQTSNRLSFPINFHNTNGGNDQKLTTAIIIASIQTGNHKLILRKWKQGARWWNLNMNHTDLSSNDTTVNNNTLSMARAEVAGYRLAKMAMDHSQQQSRKKIRACIPEVLYFSHDENGSLDNNDDPWALFSYFNVGELIEGFKDGNEGASNINIVNNSDLKLHSNGIAKPKSTQLSTKPPSHCVECKHYPSTMTKIRHEFGFDEPHPRHGRVPIDECLDYAQMILRDVVLPIQLSFFEWSASSAVISSGNTAEWTRSICGLAVTSQSKKPFQYHDMIIVYKLALRRLSEASEKEKADETMKTLLQMMRQCLEALEHEWNDHNDCLPPPLPAVVCHMDLQPQNLTFWRDDNGSKSHNETINVSQHCNVASIVDFEEAAYADPRFEVLLICRKVLANLEQAKELWESYSSSVKSHTTFDVGPIEPWLRLETVHSLFTLLLQANNLLGGGRNPWETKPDLWGKIDRERMRLVTMGWSFCTVTQ